MSDWRTVRLEDLAADEPSAISKPYGSAILKDDYRPTGIPVVRGVNLSRGIFHDSDFVYIAEEVADRMPGARLRAGDLVITHRGSVGQVSMIPRRPRFGRYATSTSQIKVRLDETVAFPEFYYYWFSSPQGRHSILEHVSTVGVPGLAQPVATVKRLDVPLPQLSTQRAVAEVLGALDSKIAANDRLAITVDEYLAGRFTALTANAPVIELAEVAQVNPATRTPVAGSQLRYVDISSVQVGRYVFPDLSNWDTAPGRARREVRVGDTLWSTVRPNRRSHALNLSDDSRLVASTGLAVLRPESGMSTYFYESTRQAAFTSYLENVAEGSAYPAVRADRFEGAPIVWADEAARSDFEAEAAPLRHLRSTNEAMNRALAGLRDSLLPRLMSGELRVRDAEKVVEETS